ncbi:unnamed protein product [Tilletia controversa]|nr:unnamed protein product [Tilletia controversa]
MSSSNQESAPNDQVARLPSGALGAGRGRVTTRSASSSLLPTATSRQSTPRVNPTEIRRGVKRTSPDLATEPIPGAQAGPQFRTASQEEEEEEPRNERAESTHSGLSRSEIRGLLRISEQRTQQDFRELLSESDRRNQQLVDDAERRHQEQMAETQAQNAYSQARNDQLLELLQTMARSINPPPRSPAPDPASSRQEPHHPPSTPFTRRAPRFSTASNLVFGNEDAHALPASFESRPPPPHLAQHTPFAFHSGEYPHPRAAKSKDIGIFKPEEGHVAYSWWMGLVQYKAFSGVSDQEIFMGLPGCFETGRAKEWFNSLTPRPKTLEEFRARLFEHFTRDESQILEEVNTRHFQPESETLDKYLDSKHRLISELHVARAVNRGPTDLDFSSIDTIMTSQTVADVIALVHQGLPAHWGVLLDGVKDNARDWPHYRASLIGREQRTRLALSMLKLKDKEPLPRANINTSSHFGAAAVPRPATAGRPFSLPHTTRPAPFGRPARSAEDEATRRKDIELGRCFHCHTTDHAKRDCPRLQEARRTVRAALTQLEEGSDDEATNSIVRSIGALAVFDVVSVSKEQHSRSAEEDDDVARVRHARRVSISEVDEDAPRVRITRKETTIELPGRRHRDVVAHKVAVHMGNDQEQFELHVDGGSPLSMVTSRALRTISPDAQILPPERLKIKGYRGDEFQRPSGVVLLPVSFPTTNDVPAVKHRFEFHVVEECTGGWILGVDNMKADGIDALSKRERLVFEHRPDAIVPLLDAIGPLLQAHSHRDFVSSPNHLVCARHTTIAAHTARLVEIDPVSADKIVQPWWFTHEEAPTGFVKVPSCIVGPNTKGIEVFNVSDVDVEFREGDVLGATEPLDGTLADLSELDDAIRHTRGPSIPPLSRSLHEWKKGNSGPVAAT